MVIIGIDEAGRGPIAGPVTVGAFCSTEKTARWILQDIFNGKLRDSKKLSPKKREEIYKKFLELKKEGKMYFKVSHISNKAIDKIGISKAVSLGIKRSVDRVLTDCPNWRGREILDNDENLSIRLDGLLKAPTKFKNQKTIIKGDEKDVFIACASIVAKVTRDRLMHGLSKKYPGYQFEIHKGYGTKSHIILLKQRGVSKLHRVSFL
jgi:ribonuclease HII